MTLECSGYGCVWMNGSVPHMIYIVEYRWMY